MKRILNIFLNAKSILLCIYYEKYIFKYSIKSFFFFISLSSFFILHSYAQTTVNFNCTGSSQSFTVPPCVTSISVTVEGAQGGGTNGGLGATVTGTLAVTPGQVLQINVGCQGNCPGAGGFGGGGSGPSATSSGCASGAQNAACGGGGASDIRVSPNGLGNRLIVAGGGGGMGGGDTDGQAGDGGCASGTSGASPFGIGGTGGTQSSGGTGSGPWAPGGNSGQNGSSGTGGAGGSDACYNVGPGGGGGGGYFGGGGGGSDCFSGCPLGGGGGGGGSSLTPVGGSCTPNNGSGNGQITITYTAGSAIPGTATASSNPQCAGQTTTLTLAGSSGTIQWEMSTNGGSTWSNIGGATASTYTTTLTVNTCFRAAVTNCGTTVYSNQVCVTATTNPAPAFTPSQTNILCNGINTGSATVTVTNGGAPLTYNWSPNVSSTNTASNLSAGTYLVTITNTFGCSATQSFTITQPAAPLTSTPSQANVSCFNGSNGSASVIANGGTGAYSYSWNTSSTSASISGLVTGNYSVTVTDSNNCTSTENYTITEPTAMSLTASQTNVTCNGMNNGSASVAVSGGTTNYSYVWSPNVSSSNTASNLGMGNYSVTITDANGCTLLRTFNISEAQPLIVTPSQTNILCNGASTGSATVSVSGGVTNYSYSWNTGAASASINNLTAGNYSVTITDGNGCISNQSFNISEPGALSVSPSQTNVLCNGASTGSASVAVSGGVSNYSYLWNTGIVSASLNNLVAGNYSVTVTDANNCTSAQNFTITEPTLLSAAPSQADILCNGASTGAASVSVSGGVTNYSYSWNTGAASASLSNLVAGNYSVTVTDANGCTLTENFTLTQPTQLTSAGVKSDVSCFGGNDGGAAVSASGGTTNYSYLWNTGATQAIVPNLPAGNYSVTVTDANGCTSTQSFTISEPTLLSSSASQTNVLCNGASTGSATVTATGGTTNYSYVWNTGIQTQNIASLQAGNYSVTVTDANNCTSTQNITISEPAALSVTPSQTDVMCFGASTGSATVVVSGGVTNYSYLWNTGVVSASLNNLVAGNYSVSVTDANNCTAAQNFTITEPTQLTSTISQTNVGCSGGNDATATVSASGGTANYSYLWNTGGSSASITNIAAGNYSVTVTDANNCTSVQSITVSQPTPLTTASSQTEVSCNGGNDGSALISASGGTTNYSYVWNTGATSSQISNLTSQIYSVTVTDANGCTSTQSYTITEPALFSFSTNSTNSNCGQNDGSATAMVSGATSPYQYLWDDGQTSSTANNIVGNMNHCVTISDANGCDTSVCVFVIDNPAPVANASATATNCKDSCNGTAVVGAFGVNPPFTYLWNNSANTDTATNLCEGNYTVTVTDSKNCTVTADASVIEPTAVTITLAEDNTICVSTSAAVSADAGGGNGSPYTYSWSNDNTITTNTQTVSPTANTCYVVFASDLNGCVSPADSQCISLFAPLSVIASNDTIVCSGADLQFIASAAGGNGMHNLSWTDGNGNVISTSQIAIVNAQGTNTLQYFVTLNDNCSPSAKDTVNVSFFINPVAGFTADTTSGCEPLTVTFINQTYTNPPNNIKTSNWIWGDGTSVVDSSFTVTHTYTDTGTFTVELDVISKDGDLCADKFIIPNYIRVNPIPYAGFTANPQPSDVQNMLIDFKDISTGNGNNITEWQWFFYDNDNAALLGTDSVKNPQFNFSSSHDPSDLFTYFLEDSGDYPVTLIIISENGCPDTIEKIIHINGVYYMNIPNAFSPNNDGLNEFFFPSGVGILPEQNFNLFIFDRWGDIVFISTNLNRPWDGKDFRGKPVQEGVYIWMLKFEDVKNEQREFLGRVTVVR